MSESELSVIANLLGAECQTDFETKGGFLVWALLILYTFYVLARLCDGHLTSVLEQIVEKLNLSEDVAGATFLAAASSAPELFCSIVATFVLVSSAGVGNIVGSALFNLLCIIGVLPVFSKSGGPLKIWWYPTMRDASFYALAIVELWAVARDGRVHWWEGAIMVASYCFYVFYFTQNQRIIRLLKLEAPSPDATEETETSAKDLEATAGDKAVATVLGKSDIEAGDGDGLSEASTNATELSAKPTATEPAPQAEAKNRASTAMKMIAEQASGSGNLKGVLSGSGSLKNVLGEVPEKEEDKMAVCPCDPSSWIIDHTMPPMKWIIAAFCMVVFWIAVFTYFMVDGADRLGCIAGIPHVVMGLTVLAAGTSVPDMIASVAVAREGMADMAAANAVGSNTFDILLGLGLPWMLAGLAGKEVLVPTEQISESLYILACALAFYIVALAANGWLLTKRLGFALICIYLGSIAFVLVRHYTHYEKLHA